MQKKTIIKHLVTIAIIIFIIILSNNVFASVQPSDFVGEDPGLEFDLIDNITDNVRKIGTFIAIGILMILGIKYITGSLEERASYKKSMMPYIIGCVLLFGASLIIPEIIDSIENINMGPNIDSMLNHVINFISLIGRYISVGVLMILGIKYMMGSAEEKATYKKSMMPYIIGCFILFGAAKSVLNIRDLVESIGNGVSSGDSQTPDAIVQNVGNQVLGIIQLIGTYISVGMIMILGIKYMMGSVEERATYKKTMIPYLIGAILLFATVNIVSIIYNASMHTLFPDLNSYDTIEVTETET